MTTTMSLYGLRAVLRLVACLAGLASTGCYSYASVSPSTLGNGMEVRMQLTGVAVDRLRTGSEAQQRLVTGFGVTGRIARLGPGDSLLVSVSTSVMEANVRMRTKEDSLVLLRSDVQQAAIRTLNRKKTAWATTAFSVAAMASVAFALQRGGRAGGGVPNPPPPPDQRYPLGMRVAVP